MRFVVPAFAAMLMASPSLAAEIVIPLGEDVEVEATEAVYDCGGTDVAVTYINAGGISLAVLEIDGNTVVASNVIAASGARYAGAQYVWWSSGEDADLYDLTRGEDAPAVNCTARG